MSHPRPISDEEVISAEAVMIGAARTEGPTTGARERTIAAIGAVGALSTASFAADAAPALVGAAVAPAAGGALGASAVRALFFGKWVGIGAVVGVFGIGAMSGVSLLLAPTVPAVALSATAREVPGVGRPKSMALQSAPAVVMPPADLPLQAPSYPPPSEPVARLEPVPRTEALPPRKTNGGQARDSASGARASGASDAVQRSAGESVQGMGSLPPPGPPAQAGSLTEEVARLDEIRAALAANHPFAAQTMLDAYRRAFGAGSMRDEALLLQIETFQALGQGGAARALAGRFLTEHPRSPYADRVRALVGKGTEGR